MQPAGKLAINLLFLTRVGTANVPFKNPIAMAKVKRRMEMATERPIEHVVVLLIKNILLSRTSKIHATVIPLLKIVPAIILAFILKTTRLD